MTGRRSVVALAAVFVAAAALAGYFLLRGRTSAEGRNPLAGVSPAEIQRLELERLGARAVLVRGEERWNVEEPFQDWADPQAVDRALETLTEFAVGSIVSENPERYDQFEVSETSATRVRVFVDGREKPVLDGYVGKPVAGLRTAYFRFADAKPVHLARNLEPWALSKDPGSFRAAKALSLQRDSVVSLRVEMAGEETLELIKSSNTWLRAGSDVVPEPAAVDELLTAVDAWYAAGFPDVGAEAPAAGLDRPYLKIRLETPSESAVLNVGDLVPEGGANGARYARLEGRNAVFTLLEDAVREVRSAAGRILDREI